MLLQLSHFFSLCPLLPNIPLPSSDTPTYFMSMGCACKFFGFSISYTILNISLSILHLPIMLLNPCTFSPFSPFHLPADNPPNNLHICDFVPVLVVCLVCFCFLDAVTDSFEFVVILMFIVLIFFVLKKSS